MVQLFHNVNGTERLAGVLTVNAAGVVDIEVVDAAAAPVLSDLREDGVWSRGLERMVTTKDGQAFVDAVIETLASSSYWRAAAQVTTPTRIAALTN